ncbi:hypothetical protein GCM10010191_74970 [Actinomadura vinacea]|uniref:Alpha/beta fold hydrolase n=1 Tax=Actinomadura vinacea TaxID=115336 RepID=A0ABN3K1L0_9ACTN
MSFLNVPGARLYYETHGAGPLLIMIPGAGGAADVFRRVAQHLATRYTVVLYDRRGFSRSELDGPQDYDQRPATDSDDVRHLIEHLSREPAVVFGGSSGAIVALEVLARHPSVVGTLVPFEPPAMRYLPGGQEWVDFFTHMYGLYRDSGIEPAITRFRERTFPASDMQVMARAPRNDANAAYWFEHELRQYPAVELDLQTLTTHADRIVFAVGREGRGYPAYDATVELAVRLGTKLIELPGGHVGYVAHPAESARDLMHGLQRASTSETMPPLAAMPDRDLGRPQPAFRTLADEGLIQGRVLDAGCGTGEHVLMCAALGLEATGVDVAPTALKTAEAKASERSLSARFLLHDARTLSELGETFDTVLDCGLLHTFGDQDRAAYIAGVRTVLAPGGRYFVLWFGDQESGDHGPRRSTRDEITAAFADGWQIDSIDATMLDIADAPEGRKGWLVALTRQGGDWIARAHIHTGKPSRYLTQLGRHADGIQHKLPDLHRGRDEQDRPHVKHVEWTDTAATLILNVGRCTLRADDEAGVLAVQAVAASEQSLRQIQRLISRDLERFGRRDHLTVDWQLLAGDADQ